MPPKAKKISLIYFIIFTLLLVALVPLVLNGWLLSERSAKELRAVEGRYQTQLVQNKTRQIEMFVQRYGEVVISFAKGLEFSGDLELLSSSATEENLQLKLKENPSLLAISIKPVNAESLTVFRSEQINRQEIENVSTGVLAVVGEKQLAFGNPQIIEGGKDILLPIASTVLIDSKISAAVVGIVSLREFQKIISEAKPMSEADLWQSGLPIVFVIDEKGNAVFHPDPEIVAAQKNFSHLGIVQEWQESNRQIQSALIPFSAEYNGISHQMIGAYSTANITRDLKFGVIAMQDESQALASVGEMWRQTWLISLALALFALVAGFLLARQLTSPLLSLVAAAQKIASGDLSTRIRVKSIKEIGTLGDAFNTMSDRLEEHIANLAKAAEENRELFVGTVKALAAAIDGKDRYTRGHSERVSRISVAIGQRMGMGPEELETLRISALLHDVGKIGIDDAILKKPAALTDNEFEIMKTHPYKGFKIMSQIPAMRDYLPGIYMHHEMINGKGYPQGLVGDDIPLQAKIVSVADTFDAITIDRPYQKGMTLEDSLNRIKSFVGSRYDGKVVEALVQACAEGQIGIGTVKLKQSPPAHSTAQPAVTV